MVNWQNVLLGVADDIEDRFDKLKLRLERKLKNDPIVILPYLGHGTQNMLYVQGRVLESKNFAPQDRDTTWENLVKMYRRFESDEIRYARLQARFGDHQSEVIANEEGFFEVRITPDKPLPEDTIIYEVELTLIDYPDRRGDKPHVKINAPVLVPPPHAQFGVISDLDDTVMKTDVLNILKMAQNTFLQNARTRLPFEGVAAFYKALQLGTTQTYNPIFYVSSSPWNLYDLIMDFFEMRDIPIGPIFLKDLGLTDKQWVDSGHESHKLGYIQYLLNTHPKLPFILVGDSGQHDPEIYVKAAQQNPSRIAAIYIRDVNKREERRREILQMADRLRQQGMEMLLVPDTLAAAEHAVLEGLIPEAALLAIRSERNEEKKSPPIFDESGGNVV